MAINKRKTPLPSPSEISLEPQSFTEKEINQLKELKDKLSNLTAQFGQLAINKARLEEAEKTLKKQLSVLEKEESNIAKSLSDKYGKGSIDIETGEFTPIEE